MSGGFANPVVGGQGILKRLAIRSINYVAGVAGWTINQDGTAEFHGLTIVLGTGNTLLVYNGTPALGSLIIAIAPASGTDAFGNDYVRGVTLSGFAGPIPSGIVLADGLGTTNRKGQITNYIVPAIPESDVRILGPQNFNAVGFGPNVILGYDDNTVNGHFAQVVAGNDPEIFVRNQNVRFIAGPGGSTYVVEISGAGHDINYAAGGYAKIDARGAGLLIGQRVATPIKWGAGPSGAQYYERVSVDSTQVIASASAFNTLTNLAIAKAYSDYVSGWNLVTGIWTCPVDGVYDIFMGHAWNGWTAGSRVLAAIFLNGGATANQLAKIDEATSNTGVTILSGGPRDLVVGDQLHFTVGQVTGVNRSPVNTTQSLITIARRL